MEISKITSAQNPLIKRFRNFNRRKTPTLMHLEGVHLHQEYLKATSQKLIHTLVSTSFTSSPEFAQFKPLVVTEIPDDLMAVISATKTPSGIISLAPILKLDPTTDPSLIVILENVQDPGNLGTILRTSLALGVEEVKLLGHCADIWNDKTLRAGMGAQFFLPTSRLKELGLWAKKFTGELVGTELAAPLLSQAPLPKKMALLLGNEGQGISAEAKQYCGRQIKIPMHPHSESLNVASAHAIICYEWNQQHQRLSP